MFKIKAINVHLTDKCNYDCDICFENKDLENPSFLDKTKLLNFIDDYKAVHIGFVGGEPLCHPEINSIIDELRNRQIDTCIVSNGIYLPSLNSIPNKLSIGIDNEQQYNQQVIQFIDTHTEYCTGNLEITITPTDSTKIEELIEYYSPKCWRVNISMLAFWDKKPETLNYINETYIGKLKELQIKYQKNNIIFFGDIDNIDNFYSEIINEQEEFYCQAPLNIFSDGHLEFCDLENFSLNMTYDSYDKGLIVSSFTQEMAKRKPCKVCSLRKTIKK